jgi:hypothetical protein
MLVVVVAGVRMGPVGVALYLPLAGQAEAVQLHAAGWPRRRGGARRAVPGPEVVTAG